MSELRCQWCGRPLHVQEDDAGGLWFCGVHQADAVVVCHPCEEQLVAVRRSFDTEWRRRRVVGP